MQKTSFGVSELEVTWMESKFIVIKVIYNVIIKLGYFLLTIQFQIYIPMDSALITHLILKFGYPVIFLLVVYEVQPKQ